MNIKILLFLVTFVMLSLSVRAQECNEFSVSFMVDGEDNWQGLSPKEIYNRESNISPNLSEKGPVEGLALRDLVSPFSEKVTLVIYSCEGDNKIFEVATLLAENISEKGFYLALSKRNFFKLLQVGKRKPILKKVYQLVLVP